MKFLGYLLIAVGFLSGAYFSVTDEVEVPWTMVVPSLLIGALGIGLVRRGLRRERQVTAGTEAGLGELESALERIVDNASRLDRDKTEISVYDVRHRIDSDFMTDLDIFVQGREGIGHRHGLQAYADVMSHFATAERYLNRCWSASTDGYQDEVHNYIVRARDEFDEALSTLRAARAA